MKDFVEMSNYKFQVKCSIMKSVSGLIHCTINNKQILNFKDNIQSHTSNGYLYDIIDFSEHLLMSDSLKIYFETIEEAFYFKIQVPEAEFIPSTIQVFSKHTEDDKGNLIISKKFEQIKDNIMMINHNGVKENTSLLFSDNIDTRKYNDWYMFIKLNNIEDVELYEKIKGE